MVVGVMSFVGLGDYKCGGEDMYILTHYFSPAVRNDGIIHHKTKLVLRQICVYIHNWVNLLFILCDRNIVRKDDRFYSIAHATLACRPFSNNGDHSICSLFIYITCINLSDNISNFLIRQ